MNKIIESFLYFFRGKEDGFSLQLFGVVHLFLLLFYLVGLLGIYNKKFGLNDEKINDKFLKSMTLILLIDQVILYLWQFISGYFNFEQSIPLFHCRIAVWLLIIGILFEKQFLKTVGIYLSFLGSVVAMVMPDLYSFSFPHYTNFQFFLVHILLGWIVMDLIKIKKEKIDLKSLKSSIIFINLFNIFLVCFNLIFLEKYPSINYGYMLRMPDGFRNIFSMKQHILGIVALFNLLMYVIYFLLILIQGGNFEKTERRN